MQIFPRGIKITSIPRGNIYDNMSQRAYSNLNFIFYFFLSIFSFRGRSKVMKHKCQWSIWHFLAENVLNEIINLLLDIDIRSELELHLTSLLDSDSSKEQIHLSFQQVTRQLTFPGAQLAHKHLIKTPDIVCNYDKPHYIFIDSG